MENLIKNLIKNFGFNKKMYICININITLKLIKMEKGNVTFKIDTKLHKKFKLECLKKDVHMSDVVEQMINLWLKSNNLL